MGRPLKPADKQNVAAGAKIPMMRVDAVNRVNGLGD
jgi:hypothetical protein